MQSEQTPSSTIRVSPRFIQFVSDAVIGKTLMAKDRWSTTSTFLVGRPEHFGHGQLDKMSHTLAWKRRQARGRCAPRCWSQDQNIPNSYHPGLATVLLELPGTTLGTRISQPITQSFYKPWTLYSHIGQRHTSCSVPSKPC